MIRDCKIGKNVKIPFPELVNLYECEIGDNSFIGPFTEIQKDVKIGKNCRIQSHSFLCSGVIIGDNVFIGHGVITINDLYPKCNNKNWIGLKTTIEDNAIIGSGATLLPVRIGKNTLVGAGAVVTKNLPDNVVAIGNPAQFVKSNKENK